ncbi:CCA tRNA nucleotidyltransferase [Abyssisolibacter fermentans]|uniref:CCA tRNA nucleotidyltransferase n=1 Tax=Abyssisolibacter fermentans TaxID=1766203 RepID=UPI0008339D55|nr:CCA tRNA nucleotidyltransferase [Abyssisolibacter fermentans]
MDITIPQNAKYLINLFKKNDYEAYVVGGCVRDSILGKKPNDWDICTSCKPDIMQDILMKNSIKYVPTGLKHGTITAIIDNQLYEITTFRIEGEYQDNRHPKYVEFTNSLIDDLSRRDFTINALAYNDESGLIDPFNGSKDLTLKTIKCVGDASHRFNEDALRILRAIRFSCQLGFKLDDECRKSIKQLKGNLKNISKERIRDEINKILASKFISYGLYEIINLELYKYIIPLPSITNYKLKYMDLLEIFDETSCDINIRMALLFIVNKTKLKQIIAFLEHLKYDNSTIKTQTFLIENYKILFRNNSIVELKQLISRGFVHIDALLNIGNNLLEFKNYDDKTFLINKNQIENIIKSSCPLSIKDLKINGDDLIQLGIKKGPQIGEILNYLLLKVLENPDINNKKMLVKLIKQKFK